MPSSDVITPVITGVAPSISATVEAFVSCTETTKQTWFAKRNVAASAISFQSAKRMRKERSRCHVKDQKSAVAAK